MQMAKVIKELAVKAGEYTNRNGETKARWVNIGRVMKTDDGGTFALIDRHFNPAGIEVEPGRDSIMVSMFDPKPRDEQSAHNQAKANGYQQQPEELDDNIPF
jgi:hypothetical protein